MLVTNLFMLVWGIKLVQATWYQAIPEFPVVCGRACLSADPDRRRAHRAVRDRALLTQKFFSEPEPETVSQLSTE